MSSVIDQIVTAAVAALSQSSIVLPSGATLAQPAGLIVSRYRTMPIDQAALPDVLVYAIREMQIERVGTESSPVSDRMFQMRAECRTTTPRATPPDVAIDPLVVWVVSALFVDQFIGGLATGLQHHGTEWDAIDKNKIWCGARVDFAVRYAVLAADPTTDAR